MPYDYSKLRGRMVEKCGSVTGCARVMGIAKSNLTLKINNKTRFSQRDISKIAKILNIPNDKIGEYFFKEKVNG